MFVQKYVPERPQQLHSSGPHTGNQALQAKRGCHSGASTQRGGVTSGWGTRMGLKGVTQGEKANLRRLPRAVSTYVRTLTRQTGARPRVSPRGSLGRGHGSCGDHGGGSRKCYVSSDCTEPHTSAHARAHTHTHTHTNQLRGCSEASFLVGMRVWASHADAHTGRRGKDAPPGRFFTTAPGPITIDISKQKV